MEKIEIIQIREDEGNDHEFEFFILNSRYMEEYYDDDDDDYNAMELQVYKYKKERRMWGDRSWYEHKDFHYFKEDDTVYESFFVEVDKYKRGEKNGRIKSQVVRKFKEKRKRVDRSPPAKARKNVRSRAKRMARR